MTIEGSQYLNLSFYFAFFDWFEHLHYYIFIICNGDTHVDLGVFTFSNFSDDFVSIDISE